MSDTSPLIERTVRFNAKIQFGSALPGTLVACSYDIDGANKEVRFLAHFDDDATDEDESDLYYIDGEIGGQLPEDWSSRMFIERLAPGQQPNLRPGGVLYRRGDLPQWEVRQR